MVLKTMERGITGKVPWIVLVELDVGDYDPIVRQRSRHLPPEVMADELLVRRMKPEPRRELRVQHPGPFHPHQLRFTSAEKGEKSSSSVMLWRSKRAIFITMVSVICHLDAEHAG